MIKITVDWNKARAETDEPLPSGSVEAQTVRFVFSEDWEDLDRCAVFSCNGVSKTAHIGYDGSVNIPWECLAEENAGWPVLAGARGTKDASVVVTTELIPLGILRHGAVDAEEGEAYTPSIYEQLIADIQDSTTVISRSVDAAAASAAEAAASAADTEETADRAARSAQEAAGSAQSAQEAADRAAQSASAADESETAAEAAAQEALSAAFSAVQDAVEQLLEDADTLFAPARSVEITIPASGWTADGDLVYLDLAAASVTEQYALFVSVSYESYAIACSCGLLPTVEIPRSGVLRFHASAAPAEGISASCLLMPLSTA